MYYEGSKMQERDEDRRRYSDPNQIPVPNVKTSPTILEGIRSSLFNELNFKELRKKSGFTLREVENKTGISNPYLSQLETGKVKNPSYKVVATLINLYNIKDKQ